MGQTTQHPVLAVGELLWDVLPGGAVLGGAPANFAFRLQTLGTPARLASRIGADELGFKALALLASLGVDVTLVQTDPVHPTGTVDVSLDAGGNASYVINEGVAYDFLQWEQELEEAAARAPLICFGSLVQRAPATQETVYAILEKARQATKLLDINLRKRCYTRHTIERSLRYANIVKLNEDEARTLGTMLELPEQSLAGFAKKLVERYELVSCVVTRGAHGVVGVSARGEEVSLPGYAVNVVDTIGSGDAFTAGFVHRYLKGANLETCCEFGNRIGALVATTKGGMTPLSKDQIENFKGRIRKEEVELAG